MAYRNWLALLAVAGLMACGGGRDRPPGTRTNNSTNNSGTLYDAGVSTGDSGTTNPGPANLDRSADISELTPAELATLCDLAVDYVGVEPTTCGEGLTIEGVDYDECVSGDVPTGCTVGQYLDCLESLDGDACNFFQTPQCGVIFQCGQ